MATARKAQTTARKAQTARLSLDDWIAAGFETIAEEGLQAVKVDRLCRRLGVTKGSFYWHFTDIEAYREALAAAWRQAREDERRRFAAFAELPPRERLSQMMASLSSPRTWTLERAVREWARSDHGVASALRVADRWVLRVIRTAFLDAGFAPDEAEFRARTAFAAGVGLLHLSPAAPSSRAARARERERFLDFMMRP